MATETNNGGSGWLAFVVGALLVIVIGFGYMVWTGKTPLRTASNDLSIHVQTPDLPKLPVPEVPAAPPQSVPH